MPDALDILTSEHRDIANRFEAFFNARSAVTRVDLVPALCQAIRRHLTLEREVFLPAVSTLFEARIARSGSAAKTLPGASAIIDYGSVEKLLADIETADPLDEEFTAKVYVLSRMMRQHALEAEQPHGLFDTARRSTLDRERLGRALLAWRERAVDAKGLASEGG